MTTGTDEAGPAARARRRHRPDLTTPGLLGLPLAWLLVFFVVPICFVGAYSVGVLSLYPGTHAVTLSAWHDFVHGSVYLTLFWRSVRMSLTVSVVVVVARLSARLLSRAQRHEAEIRPAARPDRAVPDELPPARARLEGDPGLERGAQQPALLDGPPLARPPDLAVALQQVRGHAGARLRLASLRRAPDLRLARESRSAPARGGERSRRKPLAGLPEDHAAALAYPA